MGSSASSGSKERLNQSVRKKLDKAEINTLRHVYDDLASRSSGPLLDRSAFLSFVKLPGIVGDLLFRLFDKDRDGRVTRSEFVGGLAKFYRGTMDEKINLLFAMCDASHARAMSRQELTTLLHSFVTQETVVDLSSDEKLPSDSSSRHIQKQLTVESKSESKNFGYSERRVSISSVPASVPSDRTDTLMLPNTQPRRAHSTMAASSNSTIDPESSVEKTERLVESLVKKCFHHCIKDERGRVHIRDFKKWLEETPDVKTILEKFLYADVRHLSTRKERRVPFRRRAMSLPLSSQGKMGSSKRRYSSIEARRVRDEHPDKLQSGSLESLGFRDNLLFVSQMDLDAAQAHGLIKAANVEKLWNFLLERQDQHYGLEDEKRTRNVVQYEGYLYKLGAKTRSFRRRWCKLQDSLFHEFRGKSDMLPSRVLFTEGYFVQAGAKKFGYYSIHLKRNTTTRVYYTKTSEDQKMWIQMLQEAGRSQPIENFYEIKEKIGKGRFSTVHRVSRIDTKENYAVKILEKKEMSDKEREKEALRTEISVLRLVRHPHIIRMRDLFETSTRIYIVMDLVTGGDLFDRILKRKMLPEYVVKTIMFRLLSAVNYLHRRGIVHRDLKPENILCVSQEDDSQILITDFGLSKFSRPDEVMQAACGTLAYIAPEVLSHRGYSKAVDIWSLGVIFYLMMRGGLPFDGKSKAEIVNRTLNNEVKFRHPRWKYTSCTAKSLIRKFLQKDPSRRITVSQALSHSWFNVR